MAAFEVDAFYRIEKRIGDLEDREQDVLTKIARCRVYTLRANLNKASMVWNLWRVFSPSRWV